MATPETTLELESRIATLEAKVEKLQRVLTVAPDGQPWWKEIVGVFADDHAFEEAMRLGREYRESLRPKRRSRQSRSGEPAKAKKR